MSQFIEMFGNPLSLNQKNELKRLGECCILNPRRPNIALCDTDKVSFIPMPAVSEDGYLVDMTGEEYGKVKKGFTYFENNDVLFAKITPCMENGKGAIVHGLTNGIGMGSTEFHVLRPINGISSPYWLLALTRMPIFRERAAKNMSGTGGQKRVSASYLDHFMVGLPAIEEQRRFEAIYKQADKSKFDDFKSQFIEMFGNSPQKELGELATFVNGSAFKPEEWSQEGLPIVRIQNLTQGDAPYNYYSGDTSKKVCLNTGDILVSWSATLGVFTWSKGPALLNQHIFKVVFDKLDIEQSFFIYTVKLALEKMADKAHGSTMRHVVKKDFDSTKVSFPSMREQQRFVSIAEQADKSKSVIQKALVYLNDIQSGELGKIA